MLSYPMKPGSVNDRTPYGRKVNMTSIEVIAEHTVRITADGQVDFTCHGDSTAECHQYPDCTCESWDRTDHPHPFVPHDRCWMQDWFDNDGINPSSDILDDCDYTPGMWGPIETEFCHDYVEWSFVDGTGVKS